MSSVQFELRSASGDVFPLTDCAQPIQMTTFPQVFGPGKLTIERSQLPALIAGSMLGRSRFDEGALSFGIRVFGTTETMLQQIERMASALSFADARLVATRPDGTQRSIAGRYASGLDSISLEHAQSRHANALLTFACAYPFWSDLVPTVRSLVFPVTGSGLTDTPWSADIPWSSDIPWNGYEASGSDGAVTSTIEVDGSAGAWPRFTIAGPLTRLEAVNASTMARPLIWAGNVATGETLTIETRDRSRSIRIDSRNAMGGLNVTASSFWRLEPGRNIVSVATEGAATTTALELAFTNDHLTC